MRDLIGCQYMLWKAYRDLTSCPATVPLFLRVKVTVTTFACNLKFSFNSFVVWSLSQETYVGSREEPGPEGEVPPAVDPVMVNPEYWKVVYDRPKPKANRGVILAWSKWR